MKSISKTKAKHIFSQVFKHFFFTRKKIPPYQQEEFKKVAKEFHEAIEKKDKKLLKQKTTLLKHKQERILPKATFRRTLIWIFGLVFTFFVAFVIRQMWLELYTVPTGSMRPTLKEQDKMIVSKSKFGINRPFAPGHYYFNPNLVDRLSIVVLSGNNLDIPNPWTKFLGVLPVKKQYIKRLVAKPLDTVYFYGGKLYGFDQNKNPIEAFDSPILKEIEYIPYIYMQGREKVIARRTYGPEYSFSQFGIPLIKAFITQNNFVATEVFNGKSWKVNTGNFNNENGEIEYREFFGMNNFAKARLITSVEKKALYPNEKIESPTGLFVEIFSLPKLVQEAWEVFDDQGIKNLRLKPNVSLLPLEQKHIELLMQHMTTARFVIQNHQAFRYDYFNNSYQNTQVLPNFVDAEDGTYAFFNGTLMKIDSWGNRKKVDANNPLYSQSIQNVQNLFNHGFEFHLYFSPKFGTLNLPSRYAYFNEGDLYLLGHKIFDKNDQVLIDFVENQQSQAAKITPYSPFVPFVDNGPPLKDGKLDFEKIEKYGLKIPKDYTLMLGDNHSMSGDSREFGFVPMQNVMGTPMFKFWPLQDFGRLNQPLSTHFSFSNIFIWLFIVALYLLYRIYGEIRYRYLYNKIKHLKIK